MAVVANNLLTEGVRGMFGKTFVFRTLRNKTVVSPYTVPSKKKETQAQKATRTKFGEAAFWAKITLRDPERKAYYLKKAKKLGLPNAYTAAVTDYMRKPKVSEESNRDGVTTYLVTKKQFPVKSVEVKRTSADGVSTSEVILADSYGECEISLTRTVNESIVFIVTDQTWKQIQLQIELNPVLSP